MRAWIERTGHGFRVARDGLVRFSRARIGPVPRGLAVGVVVSVAVVAALAAVVSGSGGSAGSRAADATQQIPQQIPQQIIQPVHVPAAELAALPSATTFTSIPAAPLDPAPFATTGGIVLRPLTAQIVYADPGKPPVAVLPATELGGPTWVPVIQTRPGWDEVLLPSRPNHASGWIFTGGANGSRLDIRSSSYLVRMEVGARKLSISEAGRVLGTWTVAVGAPATPTPTGRTFVLALLQPAHPTYSPLILPLGFHSNTLDTFGGGPGTVGLHGWPDPSVFGHAISHGCVRVPAAALRMLAQVPLGSLVLITA